MFYFALRSFLISWLLHTSLPAVTPTEKFLTKISEEEIAKIIAEDALQSQQAFEFNQYADFFRDITAQENETLIGYHATTLEHYIFQEFVKAILEQQGWILPDDFYFLRIPGDPAYDLNGTQDILEQFPLPLDDSEEDLQKLLVSLNISLYGNCSIPSESTIHIFANNTSIVFSKYHFDELFQKAANTFFQDLDLHEVREICLWAKNTFPTTGIILQFFYDPVDPIYSLDSIAYASGFYGNILLDKSVQTAISDLQMRWEQIPSTNTKLFFNEQIRLIITNDVTLNPYSGLKIKQHDLIPLKLKQELHQRIRALLPTLPKAACA